MCLDAWLTVQFGVAIAMLAVGSYHDLATRIIPNKVWLVGGLIGGFVAVGQYGFSVLLGVHFLFAALLGGGFYLVWRFANSWVGGADVKAIMALGVILAPWAASAVLFSLGGSAVAMLIFGVANRLSYKEIMGLKAPFIPFMLFGTFVALVVIAAA